MKRTFTALCALLAIFLSVTGWATFSDTPGLIFQIMFMPVTLYLTTAAIFSPEISFSEKKPAVATTTAIFVVLVGLALLRIFNL